MFIRDIFIFSLTAILLPPHLRTQQTTPPLPTQEAAPAPVSASAQQAAATEAPVTFEIAGSAHSGKTPLPGVSVTAANTLTGKRYVSATNSEGKFTLTGLGRGRYVVRVEFMGFAAFTEEVVLNPENPAAKVDAELILASRQKEPSNNGIAAMALAGRGFQSLAMESTLSSLAAGNGAFGGANGSGRAHGIGQRERRAGAHAGFRHGQRRRAAAAHPGISRSYAAGRRRFWP